MDDQQVSTLIAIPGFNGYFFNEYGEIFSNIRKGLKKLTPQKHGGKTKKTYYRVKIKTRLIFVHRLVAAYIYGGEIPPHLHVNHKDGDTENNRLDNLEVVTHKQNSLHAKENGLYCRGEEWYKARAKGKTSETSRKA